MRRCKNPLVTLVMLACQDEDPGATAPWEVTGDGGGVLSFRFEVGWFSWIVWVGWLVARSGPFYCQARAKTWNNTLEGSRRKKAEEKRTRSDGCILLKRSQVVSLSVGMASKTAVKGATSLTSISNYTILLHSGVVVSFFSSGRKKLELEELERQKVATGRKRQLRFAGPPRERPTGQLWGRTDDVRPPRLFKVHSRYSSIARNASTEWIKEKDNMKEHWTQERVRKTANDRKKIDGSREDSFTWQQGTKWFRGLLEGRCRRS